jgi:hypothetical protein
MKKKDKNASLNAWIPSQMGLNQYEKFSYTSMPIRCRTPKEGKIQTADKFLILIITNKMSSTQ